MFDDQVLSLSSVGDHRFACRGLRTTGTLDLLKSDSGEDSKYKDEVLVGGKRIYDKGEEYYTTWSGYSGAVNIAWNIWHRIYGGECLK